MPVPVKASTHHDEPLLYIEREAKHIQRQLQVLIDAQSEGLLAGLGGPRSSDSLSHASVSAPSAGRTVPVRQPARKKIGLRAARNGIRRSMHELQKLREEERGILGFRFDERHDALGAIDQFRSKKVGLEKSIATIQTEGENQRARDLREEARDLEADMRQLETKLLEMKAKHRRLVHEIAHVENSVEAKLSSYQASLSLLESDIRKYLKDPPLKPLPSHTTDTTFYALPPQRRTLEMAQEHWQNEQEELRTRQREVDREIHALEEGGDVWKQVVADISAFEKRLQAEMRSFLQTESHILRPDESAASAGTSPEDRVQGILEDLEATTHRVEAQLDRAEENEWKLLVCCIAAELEALREARAMLSVAFGGSQDDHPPSPKGKSPVRDDMDDQHASPRDGLGVDHAEPPADGLGDVDPDTRLQRVVSRSEDEDDEPDPAWLLPEA